MNSVQPTIAKTAPAFVIVDTPDSSAVIQPGHPSAQSSAYEVEVPCASEVPTDAELDAAVEQFVQAQNFPLTSYVYAVTVADCVGYTLATTLTRE